RERLLNTGSTWTDLWDARLHGGLSLLHRRFDEAVESWITPRRTAQRKIALLGGVDQILFLAGAGVALLLTARDAISGRTSAGSVAQAFIVVTTLASLSAVGQFTISLAARSLRSMDRVLWLQRYVERHAALSVTAPQPGTSAVRLVGASYTYPGAVVPALHPVTLDIPEGAFVVVVGENGSGKSTLADLILGVRSPSTGTVDVSGRDAVMHSASTVAQNFVRYELRVRDAVGFGDTDLLHDDESLAVAARDAAASGVFETHGWDAQLGEQWQGGVALSGGQWQRVATARGLVCPHRVVVLDEPASALDALAEARLIATLQDRARRDGSTTHILVTHRLDATRSADLVIVLDHGRAVEIGSPAALKAADGHYAHLWRLHRDLTG
ncbi:ABC transporter ATP-binding protein, partial [uncultured Microbacterium sp.]|uniref:ATP-binding cassette domain-containing protein n=1 Tax=uncultured Microbacterium sp. TaxID=191216 RepID=UPI0025E00365